MALAKLWTALFGKRDEGKQAAPSAAAPVANVATTTARETVAIKTSAAVMPTAANANAELSASRATRGTVQAKAKAPAAERAVNRPASAESKRKGKKKAEDTVALPAIAAVPAAPVKQFQRRHTAWTKRFGGTTITSILDLCVADSSHMVELLESVVDSSAPAPKYVAINQFELGTQGLSLQQFHKHIRTLGGSPVAIPMSLGDGLKRLSQTLGTVDLILLNETSLLSDPELSKLFKRVMRPTTLVFVKEAKGQWQAVSPALAPAASGVAASIKLKQPTDRSSQPERSRKAA